MRSEGGAGSGLKRVEAGEGQEESAAKALRLVPLRRGREHQDLCPQAGKGKRQEEQLETDQVAGLCETLKLSTLELIPTAAGSSQRSVLSDHFESGWSKSVSAGAEWEAFANVQDREDDGFVQGGSGRVVSNGT